MSWTGLLVSTSLIADLTVKTGWEVPFKPHAQLLFHWMNDLAAPVVQQIQKYQPSAQSSPIRSWSGINLNIEMYLSNGWRAKPTPMTQRLGALYHKIERYVLQGLDKPTYGRGTQLQLLTKATAGSEQTVDSEERQFGILGSS